MAKIKGNTLLFAPSRSGSIERFTEDQAFLRSYDSAPRPPPPPSCQTARPATDGRLRKRGKFLTGDGGEGDGRGAETYDGNNALALYKSLNTLWPRFSL